ncbi:MAG: 4Fe-4S binding protein [Candidatus Eremiobacteraeota bacterium]|nr:4Fe-4S binding protein [Candidatus Eremiobacteraeota bacterium]
MTSGKKPSNSSGRHKRLKILPQRCKGCGFCIEFCPSKVLEFSDEFNSQGYHPPRLKSNSKCTYCGMCQMICPEMAIYIEEDSLVRYEFE